MRLAALDLSNGQVVCLQTKFGILSSINNFFSFHQKAGSSLANCLLRIPNKNCKFISVRRQRAKTVPGSVWMH